MNYLGDQSDHRADPRRLLEGAKTLVAVALSYAHDPPAEKLSIIGCGVRDAVGRDAQGRVTGKIARYARGDDYHVVLKEKLHALARAVSTSLGRPIVYRACVDTAALLEREAAQKSGLGFIAKNTMLIAPGVGSYVVLGELLTDLECAFETPTEKQNETRCGQCRSCLDACPTGAFVDAYTLDARRCIAYLTIEHTGPIPRELRSLIGDRIFGCDICQEVCPFNASAKTGAPELAPRPRNVNPALEDLLALGAAQFRKWQRGSALRRIHRPQLQRNVCVALGNVGDASSLAALGVALESKYPLVRMHAAWAIGELGRRLKMAETTAAILRARRPIEEDEEVKAEIALAQASNASVGDV